MRVRAVVLALATVAAACTGDSASDRPTTTTESAGPTSTTPADTADPPPPSTNPAGDTAIVVHVDDGDSLIVTLGGSEERVRLIGINAPERDECLGEAARASLIGLVDGLEVVLESDEQDRDQFDRLLRHVWIDGTLVSEEIAARGLAIVRPYEPNLARQDRLEEAENRARSQQAGIWSPEACGGEVSVDIEVLAIQSDPPGRDADDLNGEFVIFENVGAEPADLGEFVLRDGSSSNRYTLPPGFVVGPGERFVVYVGCGDDTTTELYWCANGPVWSNDGDELFLTDPQGTIVTYESY